MSEISWGLFLTTEPAAGQTEAEVFERALGLTDAAERGGIDQVWVTEHHFMTDRITPSALALASFLLGRTRRIDVGTAVTLLPLYPPAQVAEQAALLDQLSGGRFRLGVGRGMPLVEYDLFGRGLEPWETGFFDSVDAVRESWAGWLGGGPRQGGSRSVPLVPMPVTPGGPPVHVAAGSAESVGQAAERGLPLLLFLDKPPQVKAEMVAQHAQRAVAAGQPEDGYEHAFLLYTEVTDSEEMAAELMRDRAEKMVGAVQNLRRASGATAREMTEDELRQALADTTSGLQRTQAVGSPDLCADRLLEHIIASGCRRVLCQVECSYDLASSLRTVERLTTEVIPLVEKRLADRSAQGA